MEDLILNHKRILIVDDEPDLLEIITSEFDLLGANVFQSDSVDKAIAVLESSSIDIVISDVRMPNKTGIDLLKYLKNKNVDHPPIILISGYSDFTIQEIYDLGAEGFLSKPFRLEDLIHRTVRLIKFAQTQWPHFISINGPGFTFVLNFNLSEALEKKIFLIGRGGCSFVIGDHTHLPHIDVDITFLIKFNDFSFKGEGVTRWLDRGLGAHQLKIGLEFLSLDSESHAFIKNFINQAQSVAFIPCLK